MTTTSPALPVALITESERIDAILPDDGSQVAALRRALLLALYRRGFPHPGSDDAAFRERHAINSLLENQRNATDMAIIAEGLAEMDIDHGPSCEDMVAEHAPDMSVADLRRWASQAVDVLWSAMLKGADQLPAPRL